MNRIIISIEVQDHGGKEANIIVRGERNNQIMFEEQFDYKDEEKHSLRLHLLSERFHRIFPQLGDSLGILCIRKLFNDITIRSKIKLNPDISDEALDMMIEQVFIINLGGIIISIKPSHPAFFTLLPMMIVNYFMSFITNTITFYIYLHNF